jgi:hypothetical protein
VQLRVCRCKGRLRPAFEPNAAPPPWPPPLNSLAGRVLTWETNSLIVHFPVLEPGKRRASVHCERSRAGGARVPPWLVG